MGQIVITFDRMAKFVALDLLQQFSSDARQGRGADSNDTPGAVGEVGASGAFGAIGAVCAVSAVNAVGHVVAVPAVGAVVVDLHVPGPGLCHLNRLHLGTSSEKKRD